MISIAATEALDKGLLPGNARLLLIYFLKEAETEHLSLRMYFCDLCETSEKNV